MTKPILIIGATSGIGKLTMEAALARGLDVRAFARSAGDLPDHPHLERRAGNALDANDVAGAIAGAGPIIVTLGIRERPGMIWERETLFSESTALLLSEMEKAGMIRLIVVTGFGAGRSRQSMSAIERMGHGAILGRVYADKTRQEELIVASTLDWTIARPVILRNRPASGPVRVLDEPSQWRNGLVSRADVAEFLVDEAQTGAYIRKDVVLAR